TTSQKEIEGTAQMAVLLSVSPLGDRGRFTLLIDDVPYVTGVHDGGSTGWQIVNAGLHTATLKAAPGTDLSRYTVTVAGACDPDGSVAVAPEDITSCTITAILNKESVLCFVFDDDYSNIEGPSDAIYISGRPGDLDMACIPDSAGGHGSCHKWFGRCYTAVTHEQVYFSVFDDGYGNPVPPFDALFVPEVDEQVCGPNALTEGLCRKWFGKASSSDGRSIACRVFDDGYANIS